MQSAPLSELSPAELKQSYDFAPEMRAGLLPEVARWLNAEVLSQLKLSQEGLDPNLFSGIGHPGLFTQVFVPRFYSLSHYFYDRSQLSGLARALRDQLEQISSASKAARAAVPLAQAVYHHYLKQAEIQLSQFPEPDPRWLVMGSHLYEPQKIRKSIERLSLRQLFLIGQGLKVFETFGSPRRRMFECRIKQGPLTYKYKGFHWHSLIKVRLTQPYRTAYARSGLYDLPVGVKVSSIADWSSVEAKCRADVAAGRAGWYRQASNDIPVFTNFKMTADRNYLVYREILTEVMTNKLRGPRERYAHVQKQEFKTLANQLARSEYVLETLALVGYGASLSSDPELSPLTTMLRQLPPVQGEFGLLNPKTVHRLVQLTRAAKGFLAKYGGQKPKLVQPKEGPGTMFYGFGDLAYATALLQDIP